MTNLAHIQSMVEQACDSGAELVLLPEAAVTGLINDDDPAHDLPLGQTIPGPTTDEFGRLCRRLGIWLGFGLIERDGNCLYDSAVLIGPDGTIGLHYRRMQPQWHGRRADPAVYKQGSELPVVTTPLGKFIFLICGDLFDDVIVARARQTGADWLLYPYARCFSDGSNDQTRWDVEEMPIYRERVALAGITTLMTSYVAGRDLMGGSFGGAAVLRGDGTLVTQHPLGSAGMLIVEL